MNIGLEVISQKHVKFNCPSFWVSTGIFSPKTGGKFILTPNIVLFF